MRVLDGHAVSSITTNSDPVGVSYTKNTKMEYGYIEVDLKIDDLDGFATLFARGVDANNAYVCQVGDLDSDGSYDIGSLGMINSNYSLSKFCSAPGNDDEIGLNLGVISELATEFKFGCEVVKDGANDVVNAYINRVKVSSYVIGSGVTQDDCATASIDPVIPFGKWGFGNHESNAIDVLNQNTKLKEIRIYSQKPF
jgi:hypothetical protein